MTVKGSIQPHEEVALYEQKLDHFARYLAANPEFARHYREHRLEKLELLKREAEKETRSEAHRAIAHNLFLAEKASFEELQRRYKAAKARLDEAAGTHRQRAKELLGEKQGDLP